MEERWMKHYSSKHKILLVGEGDFSFSLCLAKAFGSAINIIATSLESKDSLRTMYSKAISNLNELESLGCTILHGVDAHTMNNHPLLHDKLFDRIVFNFPHAGFQHKETSDLQIQLHQNLVRGFMISSSKMVSYFTEIHVTHKTAYPFSKWEIVKLAKKAGLLLKEEVPFYLSDYENYCNKRGNGYNCDRSFPVGNSSTFKFVDELFY